MCSWNKQFPNVIGVGPQWATTNVRQKATVVCEVRGSQSKIRGGRFLLGQSVQSAPMIPVYTLKRSLSKDSLTINALMLLKEFYGNAIKQTRVKYRLSAITASCDRLKKCLTQSCCSANYVTQYVLLKQNNRINLFSTV